MRRQRCTYYLPGGERIVEKFEAPDLMQIIGQAQSRKWELAKERGISEDDIGHSIDCFVKPLWKRFWDWATW